MNPKVIDIETIEEGMLAADDIRDLAGAVIVRKNMPLEGKHMTLFKRAMISQIRVLVPQRTAPRDFTRIDDYPDKLDVLKAAKILIVDDSKFSRFKLEKTLREAGLNVVGTAADGIDPEKVKKSIINALIVERGY